MSGALDDVFAGVGGVAESLIDEFGTFARLKRRTGAGYNPRTGQATAGEVVTTTMRCSPPQPYNKRDIDGTAILQGDMRIIVPTTETQDAPAPGETIEVFGIDYRVISNNHVASGNQIAAWEIQLRK